MVGVYTEVAHYHKKIATLVDRYVVQRWFELHWGWLTVLLRSIGSSCIGMFDSCAALVRAALGMVDWFVVLV